MGDVRKRLRAAEERLGVLMERYDDLVDANGRRMRELGAAVADGKESESELLHEQVLGEERERVQRSAVMAFEADVVEPLREAVRELEVRELREKVEETDREAVAARRRLEVLRTEQERQEQELAGEVRRLEERSARLQVRLRRLKVR